MQSTAHLTFPLRCLKGISGLTYWKLSLYLPSKNNYPVLPHSSLSCKGKFHSCSCLDPNFLPISHNQPNSRPDQLYLQSTSHHLPCSPPDPKHDCLAPGDWNSFLGDEIFLLSLLQQSQGQDLSQVWLALKFICFLVLDCWGLYLLKSALQSIWTYPWISVSSLWPDSHQLVGK